MRADLKIEAKDEDKKALESDAAGLAPLFARFRSVLGDRITEVRATDRLTESPCCLVLAGGAPHGYIERLLRETGREVPKTARILEVNPKHPVVADLSALIAKGDVRVDDWIEVLYGQSLVAEGAPLDDPNGFARRVTSLLASASRATLEGGASPQG
jgi:molecular chaperone HtpG